jgi:hypothetical protein
MAEQRRPTLAQVRRWPPTVNVETAASALGVSRAGLYEAIRDGMAPVEVITVSHRMKVLTASLLRVLEGRKEAA